MNPRTITVKHNNNTLVLVLSDFSREHEKEVRDVCFTTLKRLEEIMTVSSALVREELRKKNPLIGISSGALRAYRMRENFSQAKLASKAGLKQHHISEMEKGKRGIGIKSAKALAKVLHCKWERLVS